MSPKRQPGKTRGSPATRDTVPRAGGDVKQLPLPPPFPVAGATDGAPEQTAEPVVILTIGHSNHPPAAFLALLRLHGLAAVVDVRSAPYSRYAPHFRRGALQALLHDAGIRYSWRGDLLGGRPDDPDCYRDGIVRAGNVDYAAMARQGWYRQGIEQLVRDAAGRLSVVLCSEEDPRRCHRHRLLEPSLRALGVVVRHIRGDGALESIDPGDGDSPEVSIAQLTMTGMNR